MDQRFGGDIMTIYLDEMTCPVCGIVHTDHIINGAPEYHDVIWEESICDACDSWAWLIECEGDEVSPVPANVGDAEFLRARVSP